MRFVYAVDAADNLFPSIHCLVSWFCYIGLRGRRDIPVWYRGRLLHHGGAGLHFHADDEAACDRGCVWRRISGRILSEDGEKAEALQDV